MEERKKGDWGEWGRGGWRVEQDAAEYDAMLHPGGQNSELQGNSHQR